jgi:hypothetical protein
MSDDAVTWNSDHKPAIESDRERAIHRLVSGDLDAAQRRELLLWLDSESTRWRWCAMAFLQAQSWQEAFKDAAYARAGRSRCEDKVVVGQTSPDRVGQTSHTDLPIRVGSAEPEAARSGKSPVHRPFVPWFAVAAAVLMAFWLGFVARGRTATDLARAPSGRVHESKQDSELSHRPGLGHSRNGEHRDTGDDNESESVAAAERGTGATEATARAVALLTLREEGGGSPQEISLPVLEMQNFDPSAMNAAPAVPEYVERRLERHGYRLHRERKVLSLDLTDGRRLVIPVDQFEARYVGNQSL